MIEYIKKSDAMKCLEELMFYYRVLGGYSYEHGAKAAQKTIDSIPTVNYNDNLTNNWILCKDQMPPNDAELLVSVRYVETNDVFVWFGTRISYGWNIATIQEIRELYDSDTTEFEVIAWMFLPAPYKPKI